MSVSAVISAIQDLKRAELPAVAQALAARMAETLDGNQADDELISGKDAARTLGRTASWLSRWRECPFAVGLGRGRMYSRAGIQKYIEKRQGKI